MLVRMCWQPLYAEYFAGKLHPVTAELIGIGRKLADEVNMPVSCLLIGHNVGQTPQLLLSYGVNEVFVYEDIRFAQFRADAYANIFEGLINDIKPCVVLVGSTSIGRSLAPRKKVTADDIGFLIEICGPGGVFFGEAIHEDFTHDEMTIYGTFLPEAVVEPVCTKQVSDIMRYANEKNIPVTPRGSGTGLCGGAVALYGGILLSLAKMDKIIEFDLGNFTVTTEPGVLLMTLAQEAIDKGMMYPPDPGEKSATIGGNVMTNAGGMRAIKYGVTRDYVLGMPAVLTNGEIDV